MPEYMPSSHVDPAYGWTDDVFDDLEHRASDMAHRFKGFCESDPAVPYFRRYFHIEFPRQELVECRDAAAVHDSVEFLRKRFDLDEQEVENMRKAKLSDTQRSNDRSAELFEHSARAVVLHGLFLEKVCAGIGSRPGAKFYGSPSVDGAANDWSVVLRSGNVVLNGRRNLYLYPDDGETLSMGFDYEAVRLEPLFGSTILKLRKFVLGVALGGQTR